MAKFEIKQMVMRFNPGDVLSSEDLIKEGIDVNKWIKEGLISELPDNPIPKENKVFDLNNDGKIDKEDGKLASKVLNVIKGTNKKKGGK